MRYLGGDGLDCVLVNDSHLPDEVLGRTMREEGVRSPVVRSGGAGGHSGMGPRVVIGDFVERAPKRDLWQKQDSLRHSPARVAHSLVALLGERE